jgi:hypothetical protein
VLEYTYRAEHYYRHRHKSYCSSDGSGSTNVEINMIWADESKHASSQYNRRNASPERLFNAC